MSRLKIGGLLAIILIGIVLAIALRPSGTVNPGTTTPRGANAPTQRDPDETALIEGLQKAKKR